jgi:hypothetical protein
MLDSDYYDKFKDMVQVADQLRSDFGMHSDWVKAILQQIAVDPDIPTDTSKS